MSYCRTIAARLILVFVFISLSSVALAGEMLVFATGEWAPFFSEKLPHGGVGCRITTEALALEGFDVQYVFMPWKRAIEQTRAAQYDGSVSWLKQPDRTEDFLFSDVLFTEEVALFHNRGNGFKWKTVDDLKGMTIGVTLGYSLNPALKEAIQNHVIIPQVAPTDILNFQKLAAGRIDLFFCSRQVGKSLLSTMPKDKAARVKMYPRMLTIDPQHLVVSKAAPNGERIIEAFNKGLAKLRENGLYYEYMAEGLSGVNHPTHASTF